MSDDIAIKVEHVSKSFRLPHEKTTTIKNALVNFHRRTRGYEKQRVLQNISFEIKKGEFFGIVGRNGSGKSTLLKLLAGIYTPDSGAIHINGKLTPFIELGVGFNPELTGRENVFLNGALLGFNRKEMEGMYDEIVAFAELEKFMDQKLKNYSSGMQVRLAFSIAIRANSDILILDEVLAVGDAAFQQKCFDYFTELRAKNKTVVLVSHDMGAVSRFCTEAVYIEGGRLIMQGDPIKIADQYIEQNMRSLDQKNDGDIITEETSIGVKISDETNDRLLITFDFQNSRSDQMFIGFSIIRDGVSVAESSTIHHVPLKGSGTIQYTLSTEHLNAGIYSVGAGLFKKNNRQLLAATKHKATFTIPGGNLSQGGALKLEDNWKI